ncbi:polysaccharide deacetylase family protein [Adhaeribacter pallidiroseus]|uniref:Sialate O-acetylesterase n=1 Tax=Adhaeribacter pallidiroseus TaxID=2072847 RepID=A0A369QEH9_9BACT|nr:polysaccharide deacetylase family protein [Adhaeribacter pallidiroseus]RDC61647.1 Sialate O-acetylesterase [Adhaeribacter pallidiroseus]
MNKLITLSVLLILVAFAVQAQSNLLREGKKCTVVLTYDDGLKVHLTYVLPALDSLGLKATFYLSDYFGGLQAQIPTWRAAAAKGHELGNHTIHHPCDGSLPGRAFVKPDYDLSKYTAARITDEIQSMNTLLYAIDGKTRRTFAYPCGDTKINGMEYLASLRKEFVGARGVSAGLQPLAKVNLYNINCFVANGQTGKELIEQVKQAEAQGGLLVFLFHGVGGEHSLNVSLPAHRQLLRYLKQHEKTIWIAPVLEVATVVEQQQKRLKE